MPNPNPKPNSKPKPKPSLKPSYNSKLSADHWGPAVRQPTFPGRRFPFLFFEIEDLVKCLLSFSIYDTFLFQGFQWHPWLHRDSWMNVVFYFSVCPTDSTDRLYVRGKESRVIGANSKELKSNYCVAPGQVVVQETQSPPLLPRPCAPFPIPPFLVPFDSAPPSPKVPSFPHRLLGSVMTFTNTFVPRALSVIAQKSQHEPWLALGLSQWRTTIVFPRRERMHLRRSRHSWYRCYQRRRTLGKSAIKTRTELALIPWSGGERDSGDSWDEKERPNRRGARGWLELWKGDMKK